MRLVLASANAHKATEVRWLFEPVGIAVVPATELVAGWDVEETGQTLEANARLKARAAAAAVGEPAIADDTGLFVDALAGQPGVRSSRYAGPRATYADNVEKLLAALEGVPPARRTARFRTVAWIATPDGRDAHFDGAVEGSILEAPRGDHGFGYDPVFRPAGESRSLAELTLAEKSALSHRARAFERAARFLAANPGWLARPAAGVAGADRSD